MALISIHIVAHNSEATIQQAVLAALQQQYPDFAVVVIDNASDDDTPERLASLSVPVIYNDINIGYASAHNQALFFTDSEYVLTLNPDVLLLPGFLRAMVDAMEADCRLGAASGCLLRVDRLGETPKTVDVAGLSMSRNRRQCLRFEGEPVSKRPLRQQYIFGPDGAAAFYRRAMLEDIAVMGEVFDEDFFMHKEDVDICWRCQLRGWKAVYVPGAVAHHIRHFRPGKRRQVNDFMRFLGVRNRYLLMLKNEITPHFWRDFLVVGAYDLGILGYLLVRERRSLRAFTSLLALRQPMLEKRRQIQAGRKVEWREIASWFSTR